jgi:hypothetical protein
MSSWRLSPHFFGNGILDAYFDKGDESLDNNSFDGETTTISKLSLEEAWRAAMPI